MHAIPTDRSTSSSVLKPGSKKDEGRGVDDHLFPHFAAILVRKVPGLDLTSRAKMGIEVAILIISSSHQVFGTSFYPLRTPLRLSSRERRVIVVGSCYPFSGCPGEKDVEIGRFKLGPGRCVYASGSCSLGFLFLTDVDQYNFHNLQTT
jgi:hypothetical protein